MRTITGRLDQNLMKTSRGVEEVRLTEKVTKGGNSGKKAAVHDLGKI